MKKLLFIGSILLFLSFSNFAGATPWYDTYDPMPDIYLSDPVIPGFNSFSYTHDIKDDGFTPSVDIALAYTLDVWLYDDIYDPFPFTYEKALIDQPGVLGDGVYDSFTFGYNNVDLGWSFAGIGQLNNDGTLDVTISALSGDFYFAASSLKVCGIDGSPVPEPATMLLLGSGLAGLAGYRRKFK